MCGMGGMHRRGMSGRGVHGRGVACVVGGVHCRAYAWQERWPLKWAECILLECILVQVLVRYHCHFSISLLIHLMYWNNDMKFLIKKYSTFKNSRSNEIKANYLRHLSTNIYETV